jgi:Tfp pilus assembly protein PilF
MNAQTMPPAGPGMSRLELFLQHWRAKILLFLGLRVLARGVFEAILQKQPNDLLALNSMAYDAMQGGHMLQALGYFERARALSQDKSNAHFNHAFVCEALGRLDEAEVGFRAAIALEEKMDRAWYGLGLVLVRQGRQAQHPTPTHEPLWLVPNRPGACGPEADRRGPCGDSSPQGL